jgi:hypothetical protein
VPWGFPSCRSWWKVPHLRCSTPISTLAKSPIFPSHSSQPSHLQKQPLRWERKPAKRQTHMQYRRRDTRTKPPEDKPKCHPGLAMSCFHVKLYMMSQQQSKENDSLQGDGTTTSTLELLVLPFSSLSATNECHPERTDGCQHFCHPGQASYMCSCAKGYKLGPDHKSCIPNGEFSGGTAAVPSTIHILPLMVRGSCYGGNHRLRLLASVLEHNGARSSLCQEAPHHSITWATR